MEQPWRFYGREAETAQLRAVFLAPQLGLVAIRGERRAGKTQFLDKVVSGLPEGRPIVWHTAYGCNTPEAARVNLLDSLEGYFVTGAGRTDISKPRNAASSLQSMPDILEHLLRAGVSVAVDGKGACEETYA